MKNLRFNINKTIGQLMPYFLVKPLHMAWLQWLLSPVNDLYIDFMAYRAKQLLNATINAQNNRLTRALNDDFDQRIYLLYPNDYLDNAFIYLEKEQPVPEFDYLDSENHTPVDYDFLDVEYNNRYDVIVRVPEAVYLAQHDVILAYLKKYVFAGVQWTVETF